MVSFSFLLEIRPYEKVQVQSMETQQNSTVRSLCWRVSLGGRIQWQIMDHDCAYRIKVLGRRGPTVINRIQVGCRSGCVHGKRRWVVFTTQVGQETEQWGEVVAVTQRRAKPEFSSLSDSFMIILLIPLLQDRRVPACSGGVFNCNSLHTSRWCCGTLACGSFSSWGHLTSQRQPIAFFLPTNLDSWWDGRQRPLWCIHPLHSGSPKVPINYRNHLALVGP